VTKQTHFADMPNTQVWCTNYQWQQTAERPKTNPFR
jgi:hypothetical protein